MKKLLLLLALPLLSLAAVSQSGPQYTWNYYTTGNTGIMGDYAEALWIDPAGNPYIAAYTPGWEEGGFSKFNPLENMWTNYSNVDYPVIGSIYDVGSSRIRDIAADASGVLWMATWRGILKFDPAAGAASLAFWGSANSPHPGGRTMDIAVAPDGSVWAAVISVTWGMGGLVQYQPATGEWHYWGYGSTANNWPAVIGSCERLAIRAGSGSNYEVWIDGEGWNTMITWNSATQLFTLLPQNGVAGEVVALPGTDCIDAEGNLWALRYVGATGTLFSLDYLTPGGTWVTPPQPAVDLNDIWAFRAFGNHEALITGISSEIFQFGNGAWQSKGVWREGGYTYAVAIDAAGTLWASGIGGAARRDAATGQWQRYRITNTSQIEYFVRDLDIDAAGNVWTTANAGPGVGGFQKFDGVHWTGYNESNYGLGFPFPFPTDNTDALCVRPSNGSVVVNPMYNGLHSWNGSSYTSLNYPASTSVGLEEDSQGRLWSLGEYYSLSYYQEGTGTWTSIPFVGWGANIIRDPLLPGTVWACSGNQLMRTDGTSHLVKNVEDFPELDPQSDQFSTAIPDATGAVWLGSGKGLFRLDPATGVYQFFSPANSAIPGETVTPLAATPDGRIWFSNFLSTDTTRIGLCWYDGSQFGVFPVGDGSLPHAQIPDAEVKIIPGGYELWMSCLSRGIAVLRVTDFPVGIADKNSGAGELSATCSPNPVSGSAHIEVRLDRPANVECTLYDLTGRTVQTFPATTLPAGTSRIAWDGTGADGSRLAPGIYPCRVSAGNQVATVMVAVQ